MKRKDDDQEQGCLRSTRTFQEEGSWFFRTREGDSIGPFQDELEASTDIERVLVEFLGDAGAEKAAGDLIRLAGQVVFLPGGFCLA